jgi:hypothetical protein
MERERESKMLCLCKKNMYIILGMRVGEHYPPCTPKSNPISGIHYRLLGVMGKNICPLSIQAGGFEQAGCFNPPVAHSYMAVTIYVDNISLNPKK